MKYFFMRHGEASWQAACDAERPLTENGVIRLRKTLTENRSRMTDVDHILHSPYLRARQTAQIAGEVLGVTEFSQDARWTPEGDIVQALSSLEAYEDKTLLVVTHNPLVSLLVGAFCEGGGAMAEPFNTGTIACVEADWPATGMGTLHWKS